MKLDYKKTFLIGFGFFATSIAWSVYNSYATALLEPMTKNLTLAGLSVGTTIFGIIMTIDNIFGVIFQPMFGALSDRTKTRFGKRMPYILIGIPVCAVLFALIPTMSYALLPLMLTIIVFNFIMSTWRSPVVALMPDLTPAPLRSKANGIINLMGGVGSLLAFAGGSIIFKSYGNNGVFLLSSVIMVLAGLVLFFFVKEKSSAAIQDIPVEKQEKPVKEKVLLSKGEKKSLVMVLLAIFFWFTGYNAVETYFSVFAINNLVDPATLKPFTAGNASLLLAFFSVSFIAAALPAGILGGKIGRKKTILIGLIGVTALFIPLYYVKDLMTMRVLLLLGGMFWACVNINSLPMVVEMAGIKHIGTFTGYYYTFSCSSAIISPILFGLIHDLFKNYSLMFIYAAVAFTLAIICITFVRHGESAPVQKLSTTEVMAMQEE